MEKYLIISLKNGMAETISWDVVRGMKNMLDATESAEDSLRDVFVFELSISDGEPHAIYNCSSSPITDGTPLSI